jgi:hypothetical protein
LQLWKSLYDLVLVGISNRVDTSKHISSDAHIFRDKMDQSKSLVVKPFANIKVFLEASGSISEINTTFDG